MTSILDLNTHTHRHHGRFHNNISLAIFKFRIMNEQLSLNVSFEEICSVILQYFNDSLGHKTTRLILLLL